MQAARYLCVSVACALLNVGIIALGGRLGLHYAASTLVAFVVVLLAGYAMHSAWTFDRAAPSPASFARYAASMALNLPLFMAGMFVSVDLAGLPDAIAASLVTVLLWVFNFFAARWALRS